MGRVIGVVLALLVAVFMAGQTVMSLRDRSHVRRALAAVPGLADWVQRTDRRSPALLSVAPVVIFAFSTVSLLVYAVGVATGG